MIDMIRSHRKKTESIAKKFFAIQEIVYQQLADELHNDIGQRIALIQMLLDGWFNKIQRCSENHDVHHSILSPDHIRNELSDLAKKIGEMSHHLNGRHSVEQGFENAIGIIARNYRTKHTVQMEFHHEFHSGKIPSHTDRIESHPTGDHGHLYRFRRTSYMPKIEPIPSWIFIHLFRIVQAIFRWFDIRMAPSDMTFDVNLSNPIRLNCQQKPPRKEPTDRPVQFGWTPSPNEQIEALRFSINQRIGVLHGEWNETQTPETLIISCVLPVTKED